MFCRYYYQNFQVLYHPCYPYQYHCLSVTVSRYRCSPMLNARRCEAERGDGRRGWRWWVVVVGGGGGGGGAGWWPLIPPPPRSIREPPGRGSSPSAAHLNLNTPGNDSPRSGLPRLSCTCYNSSLYLQPTE